MPTQNFKTKNNAQGVLLAGIAAGATSVILQTGQGGLFPSTFPFPVEIKEVDTALNNYRVLKREIALCTNRSGDTLTITRAFEACPADYTATTQTQTAFSFSNPSNTIVTCSFTGSVFDDLNINKVNREDYQNQTHTYAADSGSANAYAITLSPAPTSYVAGQCFTFKATNSNTGVSTLNVNGLGVKTINKNGTTSLSSGDIVAGQMVTVEYDGTNFQITSPTPPSLPVDSFILWEGCAAWDAITTEKIPFPLAATTQVNFGNATTTQYQGFRMIGNGKIMSTISLTLKKVLSPADNCIIAIQSDSSGSPSGTDIATATIAGGTITTSNAEYTPSLSSSITPTDGTYYWVVFRRSGALDAANYYQIGLVNEETIAFPNKVNNAGAWGSNILTATPTITATWFYNEVAVRAKATIQKFSTIRLYSPSALSALSIVSKSISDIYTGLSGLKIGRVYFLSNTAGAISLTAGTVKSFAWEAKSATSIILPKRIVWHTKITTSDSKSDNSLAPWTTQFTNKWWLLQLRVFYDSYFPCYSRFEYSPDNITWTTLWEIILPSAQSGGSWFWAGIMAMIEAGFYRVQHRNGGNGTITSYLDMYEYDIL